MTDQQKFDLRFWRSEKNRAADDLARCVMIGAYAQYDARRVIEATQKIAAIVSDAHCGDCGAATNEPCSPTCGFDGPTPSDAMADARGA